MATPVLQPAFSTGEIAPNLFGRNDLAREHLGATTMRNMFVSYKGGAYSRPGTMFVGWSAQKSIYPPRLIPFQFSINQGLILEFGDHYMRIIQNGALVTENPIPISFITQDDPGIVTAFANGGSSAIPINTFVIASYQAGDTITLAGGTYTTPAVINVIDTALLYVSIFTFGFGYAPGDTITLAGGTPVIPAIVTVFTTRADDITLVNPGSGGTPGTHTITGTTGAGTPFTANVVINASGHISSIIGFLNNGAYTTNPTNPSLEPVTGAGLTGAIVSVTMGVGTFAVTLQGIYTGNPPGGTFTQASTSGTGTGAGFISGVMGPRDVNFADIGVYTILPDNPVSQLSTSGGGLGAEFTVIWATGTSSGLNTGDFVYITGVQGMTELNGHTFVVGVIDPTHFALYDVFVNPVDTTVFQPYNGGGTIARIFSVPTIYSAADLEWLKYTQSADVMTLGCVNQITKVEYPCQDLTRFSDTNWVFSPVVPNPTIGPPAFVSGAASAPGQTFYGYCVTAVAKDGTESIASGVAYIDNAVDVAATAGSITITWTPVDKAITYNIYKAEPSYSGRPPVGVLYGFGGSSFGAQWVDSNVVADFAQVPPLHRDPFLWGQIINVTMDNAGAGYTFATVTVNTSTGFGAVIEPVLVNGSVVSVLIFDPGGFYQPTDTITFNGDGAGAQGHITTGPASGTYPSVPAYFQQRRVLASSLDNPDTYWMSQPGAFTNFDTRIPTIDSDAITGTPWSLQVNGIQFMVMMPAGLAVFTGLSAWLLVGAGSFATNVQPITPSSQVATPLAFTGCAPTLAPIKINYDILYVGSKGSYYYDLPYQLYALSEPIDLTMFSSHLFDQNTVREHTWAETPFKLLWSIRDDGILLSLTYLKQQQVAGWARHDTNGRFWSIASCVEPVITTVEIYGGSGLPFRPQNADAVYVVTERHAP
jgi:hypothetical protein